jgi:EAL domain-containing protein (putative c-di-GMP-specific phosphodiesterase class I)
VSPHLLSDPRIRAVLTQAGDPGGVVVELTERLGVTDQDALQDDLAAVRNAGGRIAVDDAGSGYASLHQLLLCRPDIIKLDRALITDIGTDPAKQALVELLGAFSDRLDAFIPVVADLIESGHYLGIVRLERLVARLAELSQEIGRPS